MVPGMHDFTWAAISAIMLYMNPVKLGVLYECTEITGLRDILGHA